MELPEHLALLVDELIDAHDDTVRLSEGLVGDWRWEAHICYLRNLRRLGSEVLAAATVDERVKARRGPRRRRSCRGDRFQSSFVRRGDRRCARSELGEGPA
jgi:hypothetical protein